MRSSRLLSALLLLQAHGRLSGRILAERLEVSARTVHRDMDALSAAGVPVFAIRGAQGGWQLEGGWRARVPALDESELRGLLMAQPRVAGDPRLAASAERALTKLIAALPATLREHAATIRQRLHVDTTGWRGAIEDLSALPLVQDAVTRDRMLSIRYRQTGQPPVTREVHPLGLVAKGSRWYLVANTPRGFRTYRVSRMERVVVLDKPCKRPARFDLAAHWEAAARQFRERPQYAATLRLEPRAAEALTAWCQLERVGPDESSTHGWVTASVRFDSEDDASFIVLGLAARVEVIGPAGLRRRVVVELSAALERANRISAPHRRRRSRN